jgi:hypothetical protein
LYAEPTDYGSDDEDDDDDNNNAFPHHIHPRIHPYLYPSTCIIHISIGIAGVPSAFSHIQRTGAWQALLYTI